MGRDRPWRRAAWAITVITMVLVCPYVLLFVRSMTRDPTLDHFIALLYLWQQQTGSFFALAAALIGSAIILDQTQAARRQEEERERMERKALATGLLAEVNLLMKRLDQEKELYERRLWHQRQLAAGRELPEKIPLLLGSALESRVSVYASCADQLGKLGPELADALVNFYEFIDGIRDDVRRFYDAEMPRDDLVLLLEELLKEDWPAGVEWGQALQRRLEAEVSSSSS